jgi:uncharacterized membrane protein (UPF0182 family)
MTKTLTKKAFQAVVLLLGLWLAFELVANLVAEILWFQQVGYLISFLKRLLSQLGFLLLAGGLSAAFLLANLNLAQRYQWQSTPQQLDRQAKPQSPPIRFPWLLLSILGLSLLLGLMLLYYSQVAFQVWQTNWNLPNLSPVIPSPFAITSLAPIFQQLSPQLGLGGVLVGLILLVLLKAKFWLRAIALGLSVILGLVISGSWATVLQFWQPTSFSQNDPLFHKDISFYIFKLPVWQLLNFWLGGLVFYALISCFLIYLLSGNSISEGKFQGFSRGQLRHLYALAGGMMLVFAWGHYLARYELVYSSRGVVYGASYREVHLQLPMETLLGIISGGVACELLWKAITGIPLARKNRFKISIAVWLILAYLLIVLGGSIASEFVQRIIVQPNELERERPYIERSIAASRSAFLLNQIEAKTFNPQATLTLEELQKNHLTIDNIRLWDTRPLLQTNRQLQQFRPYYRFPDADIDRYLMKVQAPAKLGQAQPTSPAIVQEKQQVIVAPRELDYNAVPQQAKTWVNEHLVYTHGYGFTLSAVNRVGEGGLPYYLVQDIGTDGTLTTSSPLVRESIPIDKPRIYYGELANTYVMTSTQVKEFDYPSGQDNVYNVYDGAGGISIGSWWRRLLFAQYLKDWQMLVTRNFTPETKLLMRRNINRRVRAIAPFLRYDGDPYLVVADGGIKKNSGRKNHLYWMIDAYTTSDHYPYSDPGKQPFNYIRNSVKIVINAYNGDVQFYIADNRDPIVQTWGKIFPEMFQPFAAMPIALQQHIRYPEDLFKIQSERLLTYHMTDPQVFYNREDQWQIPQEIYRTKTQAVESYYLIMKLPESSSEEFILLNLYTPTIRPNLIAWLAGRSDGAEYGKLLLYQFPKQKLVYGPNQIEALINQNPEISQRISLWNREGSRALQGHLLVIPIEKSLLYVEPLYLEAEQNSLPTLARVIVAYENQIVMRESLQAALEAIFKSDRG